MFLSFLYIFFYISIVTHCYTLLFFLHILLFELEKSLLRFRAAIFVVLLFVFFRIESTCKLITVQYNEEEEQGCISLKIFPKLVGNSLQLDIFKLLSFGC